MNKEAAAGLEKAFNTDTCTGQCQFHAGGPSTNFWTGSNFRAWKVKPLKIQRQIFSNPKKELTAEEYRRLIKAAEKQAE